MRKIVKTIYQLIPFKRHLFHLLKRVWMPSENIYKHLHFTGTFRVDIDSEHSFLMNHFGYQVENQVFWTGLTGSFEKESMKLWISLCKISDTIVDAGANSGLYSLVAACLTDRARIFAFEPVERVMERLKKNNELNRYNIIAIKKALSNFTGEAIIYDTYSDHTYSVTVNKNRNLPETRVFEAKIETITLADFIAEAGIKKIDLVKLDVETHEPEVLEGFREYLKRFQPSLLLEVLNNEVAARIELCLKDVPYLFFSIDEKDGPILVENISESLGYNYLICTREVALRMNLIQ